LGVTCCGIVSFATADGSNDDPWPYYYTPLDTDTNQAQDEDPEREKDAEFYESIVDDIEDLIDMGELVPSPELQDSIDNWRGAHSEGGDPGC
jgi:hypothetical protein